MSATLTVEDKVFFAEQLKVENVALLLFLIGANVLATRTKMVGQLDAAHASYLARVPGKGRKARAGVTSKTAQAWIASDTVDAMTSSALDDRGRAVRKTETGVSSAGARGGVDFLGTWAPT